MSRKNVGMIKTPDKGQSDVWDFPVYQEELVTAKGVKSGIHAVIRGDNEQVVGQYRGNKVLPYSTLVDTFEGTLGELKLDFTRKLFTTQNGARFFGEYRLGEKLNASGDDYGLVLRLQSSHNGSLTPGFMGEGMRLACLNAAMLSQRLYAVFKKHSETFDLGFIQDNVGKAIETSRDRLTQFVDKMGGIKLTENKVRNILSNITQMGAKAGVSERAGYQIHANWKNPTKDEKGLGDTLYRLYNAATRYTRDVNNLGRFEMSRRANLYVTGAFDLAAHRKSDLDTLLATPKKSLDFDKINVVQFGEN